MFIETDSDDPVRVAFWELMQSKIRLSEGGVQPMKILESNKAGSLLESSEKV